MKKSFIEALETNPNILRVGHRNPYQFKNAIKSGGTIPCLYHLGYIVYQGAVTIREPKSKKGTLTFLTSVIF